MTTHTTLEARQEARPHPCPLPQEREKRFQPWLHCGRDGTQATVASDRILILTSNGFYVEPCTARYEVPRRERKPPSPGRTGEGRGEGDLSSPSLILA